MRGLDRRELLTGAAALAAYGALGRDAEALTGSRRVLLGGAGIVKNTLLGVNMSGAEFGPSNGQTFPTAANFSYLASKGVTIVRLPIAWESLQTTLGGTLNATYLASITTALANAAANGIKCIVDLHNFGAYVNAAQWASTSIAGNGGGTGTGVQFLGKGITSANFVDLWTKLSTALVGNAGLLGYGLMNEPNLTNIVGTNLLSAPNWFGNQSTLIFWNFDAAPAQLAVGTNPLGAGYGPAWNISSGPGGFGSTRQAFTFAAVPYTLSVYAKVASGTNIINLKIKNGTSTNQTVTTSWQRFTYTFTPTAGANTAQILINDAGIGNLVQVANAQLELGSSATAYQPSPFLQFAQPAITAIRAVDATAPIFVMGGTKASLWTITGWEVAALTGGNIVAEAHQYFDGAQGVGGGGLYSGSFASYSINTSTGSQAIASFLSYLTSAGVNGYLGEFGIPGSDTNWQTTQTNTLLALQAQRASFPYGAGTQWFGGSNGILSGNALNIITTPNDLRLLQMLAIR